MRGGVCEVGVCGRGCRGGECMGWGVYEVGSV